MNTGFRSRVLSVLGALVMALLLVVPSIGAQQGGTVTGRVLDQQSGQPLAAVQVFISSLDLGGLTQQNGRYLLQNVPAGTHTLSVARIGYRTTEAQISVGGGQTVEQNFAITEEALQLDEIIVTGTPGGTQRRAIGNTVATVNVTGIVNDVSITNFQDLLSGRTTGIQFQRLAGNVGTGSPIKIRGTGSFNLDSNPLIYVDGVRVNNDTSAGPGLGFGDGASVLDDFNPEDIESIEIIKGPSAASLYGTEASAGVIQIITKKGAEGAPEFNFSMRQGTNFMTDPAGRLGTMYTCPSDPTPGPLATSDCQLESELVTYNMYDEANRYIREGYFDWPTENLYQNGLSQSYNLDVRGGTSTIRYFVSANYESEEGVVWYNTDETFRMRANINVVFSDDISLDISTGFVDGYTRFANATDRDGGLWQDMIWSNGFYLDRINPFDNTGPGQANGENSNARLGGFQEHLPSDAADIEATRDYSRFTGAATLRHSYGGWLSQRLVVGIDKGWDINRNLFPLEAGPIPASVAGFPGYGPTDTWEARYSETVDGQMTYERPVVTNASFDYSITGDYDLNDDFSFATSFGTQYYTESTDLFANTGNGFASPLSRTINQLATDKVSTTYSFIENKSLGFYVQEQLDYQGRIFVTGSIRFDDNSTFGQDAPSQKYPNAQATWVMSEESFWNFDAINSFRLRGAWGKAGRQPSATAQNNIFVVIPGPGGAAAIRASSPGNPAIEPEVSTELEVGADFALFDDRISGDFSYYWRKDENALLSQASLSSSGVPGSTQQNLGRIDNWGWEAQLSLQLYQGESVSFALDLAADFTDNEIKELGSFPSGFVQSSKVAIGLPFPNQTNPNDIVEASYAAGGERVNSFGQAMTATCDQGISLAPQSVIDAGDPIAIGQYGLVTGGAALLCGASTNIHKGRAFPTHTFRVAPRLSLFNNTLTITAMAEGQYGRWSDENGLEWGHRYHNTLAARLLDDARFAYGSQIDDRTVRRLYANDFWKLREIGLRYTLPESVVARSGAQRASIAISARNLYTLYRSQSTISGGQIADPEYGSNTWQGGDVNYWEIPPLANINMTLRVTF